jgi:DNA-binding MarR family transcriptional regulator
MAKARASRSIPRQSKAETSKTEQEQVAMEIVKAIRRILRKTTEHSRDLDREFGLNAPQVLCLRAIADCEPSSGNDGKSKGANREASTKRSDADIASSQVTVVRLAEAVHMPVATVSRILDRLEQARYIQRRRSDDDRRRVHVSLTQLGRRKLAQVPTPLHEQFLIKLRRLDRAAQESVLDGLQRVVEMMDAADLDVPPVITSEVDVISQFNSRSPTP